MSDTPMTDAFIAEFGGYSPDVDRFSELANLARQLERELHGVIVTRDAFVSPFLDRAEKAEASLREIRDELYQSKAPVIGECEDCGHKIVTPLRRLP